jgi:hypothetical protein
MVKDERANDVLTLGLFRELFHSGLSQLKTELAEYMDARICSIEKRLSDRIDSVENGLGGRIDALESKMMEGFRALDEQIDIVEKSSEHRDRALSAQIQHIAFSKADWGEIV